MTRRGLLLVFAVLVASVGTALVALYVRGADQRARDEAGVGGKLVAVLVASRDVGAGVPAADISFDYENFPPGAVPQDAVTQANLEGLSGQVTTTRIFAGVPLVRGMFARQLTQGAEDTVTGVKPELVVVEAKVNASAQFGAGVHVGQNVALFLVLNGRGTLLASRVTVVQAGVADGEELRSLLVQADPQTAINIATASGGGGTIVAGLPGSKAVLPPSLRSTVQVVPAG